MYAPDSGSSRALKLTRSQASSTGVIMATYERGGEIKTGSFASEKPSEVEIERRKNWK
jgi:hypothetical protein